MALIGRSQFISVGDRNNPNGTANIFYGDATTRAAVLADVDTDPGSFLCGIGSLYLSSAGKLYVKVAQSGTPANTDWQKVTATAAD